MRLTLLIFWLTLPMLSPAQKFDLLIKGGHLIDPKNQIDALMDIAISDGKVSQIGPSIAAVEATQVIDATGLYVSPGFVDIHSQAQWLVFHDGLINTHASNHTCVLQSHVGQSKS